MSQVIDLRSYQNRSRGPMLVLVDLQQEAIAAVPSPMHALTGTLMNCRTALHHARRIGSPVAFARSIAQPDSPSRPCSRWIEGFSPTRSDVIVDRYKPSCYANTEFFDIVSASGGHFALAGFAGEAACLSTAVEAYHRGHKITFLSDASASHALGELDSGKTHRLITELVGLYGTVLTTAQWIAQWSRTISLSVRN